MKIADHFIAKALQAAFVAGNEILQIYHQPFDFELKPDNSPLTIADRRAHTIISETLADSGIPVLSEEGSVINYETRKEWEQFWLVDPLDGTKEFIKKNGDFTVNIALIYNQHPVFGVVYAPVPGYVYWGSESGSFRLDTHNLHVDDFSKYDYLKTLAEGLPCISGTGSYLVLGSRSHMNAETELFINNLKNLYPDLAFVSRGSSLKFCTLAEGGADIYPRFGPTMEWDTAAGHAVALFAGCTILQAENGQPLIYNKPSLLNPHFVAERKKK